MAADWMGVGEENLRRERDAKVSGARLRDFQAETRKMSEIWSALLMV